MIGIEVALILLGLLLLLDIGIVFMLNDLNKRLKVCETVLDLKTQRRKNKN